MSKKTNPTVIGGFVVGAIVLLTVSVAIFGGAEMFAQRNVYQAYFVEETNGLRVGSNVVMNGVRVGYVSDMELLVDNETFLTITRVTIEILPETFLLTNDGRMVGEDSMSTEISHDELIYDAGLRARLGLESFVTGQLLVELELLSILEPIMRGVDSEYPEIPTVPSSVQLMLTRLRAWFDNVQHEFDIHEISGRLTSILVGVDELSNSQDLRETLSGLNTIINDPDMQRLGQSIRRAMDDLGRASADASDLFKNADQDFGELVEELRPTFRQLTAALDELEQALAQSQRHLRGDSDQAYQLGETLREVEGAARSLREFFDYLERNPESLLRGKQE